MALHEQSVGATDEWFTPPYVFRALGCRFDLDVAHPGEPHAMWVPANHFITCDSLQRPWGPGFAWINPPFGGRNGLVPWLKKFVIHGNGVALVPDRTSAPWWQRYAREMDLILFVSPKIKFIGIDGFAWALPGAGDDADGYWDAGLCRSRKRGEGRPRPHFPRQGGGIMDAIALDWSPQQEMALYAVAQWLRRGAPQVFNLSGYAGTGKTTLAKEIARDAGTPGEDVLFGAFTGKAASVMRAKGCTGASTLHSLIYKVFEEPGETEDDPPRLVFMRNPKRPLAGAKLLIIDESSMVGTNLGRDVLSFGQPTLVLGDPAQLPPVKAAGFFAGEPDIMLTEIHRQAKGRSNHQHEHDRAGRRPPRIRSI